MYSVFKMNPPQKETSNNFGQGFVYFNTNTALPKQNNLDTSDFLSFSSESSPGSSPQNKDFRPSNFSSPPINNYYGKTPRNRSGRNQHYMPHNNGYGAKSWRKTCGLTRPNNNVNIYFESYIPIYCVRFFKFKILFLQEQDNYHAYNHQSRGQKNYSKNYFKPQQNKNCSVFYDSTCLLNPWQELEEKVAQESQCKTTLNGNISGQSLNESNASKSSSNSSEDKSDESDNVSYEAEESLS